MSIMNSIICRGVLAGAAASVIAAPASALDPEDIRTECYEGTAVIFASAIADIGEFDAASYDVTLLQTQSFPEHNAVLYHYGPRDIMCVVVSESE